jgi:RHS repeat-associated protein
MLRLFRTLRLTHFPTGRVALMVTCLIASVAPETAGAEDRRGMAIRPSPDSAEPSRSISVQVLHNGNGTASVSSGASTSTAFTATNNGTQQITVNFVVTTCSGNVALGSCSASPTTAVMNPNDVVGVNVYFGGGSPGSGTVTLTAKNASNNTTLSSASVAVTVTPAVNAPTISLTPHAGDRIDVSQCVADCFETTLGYSTPEYVSRDVPRSVTVLYRSGRAKPYGRVTFDVTDASTPAGSFFKLQLTDPNGSYVTFTNGTQAVYFTKSIAPSTLVIAEFDASAIATSAKVYTAYVTSINPGGTAAGTTSLPLRIIIVNDQTSQYGAGVDIVGVQRIFTSQPGGVLVTDGSGSASFFTGTCTPSVVCTFSSPGGDFSTLATGSNVYRRTYLDGTVVTFNNLGQQVSVADRFGNTTQYTYVWNSYAAKNVLSLITDPTGQNLSFYYRDNTDFNYTAGTLREIDSPGTPSVRATSLGVDPAGNLRWWYDAQQSQWALATFDTQHRLTQVTDKKGGVWTYGLGYAKTPSYLDAPAVVISGGASVSPRTSIREYGGTQLLYGAMGLGTSTANAITYNVDVRAAVTDARNNTTFFSLNRYGAPMKVYAPLIAVDSTEYDPVTGQPTRNISPTGHDVRYTWTGGLLTYVNDVTLGKTVTTQYETSYGLPTHIFGSVQEQWLTYDKTKTGWPLKTVQAGSSSAPLTNYASDNYGRPTSVTDQASHLTSYGYSTTGLQNQTSVTAANGQATTFTLDGYGRVTTVTGPYSVATSRGFDVLNRTLWTSPAYADTTKVQYDLLDAPTVVTDSKGQVYNATRNALGWIVKQNDPTSHADSMAYDVAGNVVYTRSRQGRVVTMEYDALGRVTKRIGVAEKDTITYGYDPAGRWISTRAVSRQLLVSTDTLFVDSIARPQFENTYRPGVGPWSVASTYQADKPGRVSATLKAGINSVAWVNFLYDTWQRPSMLQQLAGNTTFGYNVDQQLETVILSPSLTATTTYSYDHRNANHFYSVATVQNALGRWYTSDNADRLAKRGGGTAGQFQVFDYDSKSRLSYWTKKTTNGAPSCINAVNGNGYDCSGTQSTTNQLVAATYDKVNNPADPGTTIDPGNRLRTFNGYTMTYDLDGNMLSRAFGQTTDTYDWDDFGQLKGVTRNGVSWATFDYDGFGRRVRKWSTAGIVHYIWDGDQIIGEADASGTVAQTYTYYPGVDQPHSVTAGGETYFTSLEPNGDVNGLVRRSDNTVVAQYAYTPWGELETDVQNIGPQRVNSLRWRGLPYDVETGLYMNRSRYYDPATRRFISEDPIGLGGGINLYAFGEADPVNSADPSGLVPDKGCTNPSQSEVTCASSGGSHWGDLTGAPRGPSPLGPRGGGGGGGGGGSAGPGSMATSAFACPAGPTAATQAGQEALQFYQDIWTNPQSSAFAKTGALVGGLFAALWTPETATKTTETLLIGYSAQAYGPNPPKTTARPVLRSRETFRIDAPHHGKGWHLDGTVTGSGVRGKVTFVDVVGCPAN